MAAAGFRAAALALACAACTSVSADARTFEGTRWQVTAIDGRQTPANGSYTVSFAKSQIGGQFGCNRFGGEYRAHGDVLITTAIRMTMMACPEPQMTFESQGQAVLQQPMRLTWASDMRLTLSNGAGSIALQRLP